MGVSESISELDSQAASSSPSPVARMWVCSRHLSAQGLATSKEHTLAHVTWYSCPYVFRRARCRSGEEQAFNFYSHFVTMRDVSDPFKSSPAAITCPASCGKAWVTETEKSGGWNQSQSTRMKVFIKRPNMALKDKRDGVQQTTARNERQENEQRGAAIVEASEECQVASVCPLRLGNCQASVGNRGAGPGVPCLAVKCFHVGFTSIIC